MVNYTLFTNIIIYDLWIIVLVNFWHDYNRSGTLTFKVKMAGLSQYYGFFWFLMLSCNGSIRPQRHPEYGFKQC